MILQMSPYTIPLLVTGVICLAATLYAYRQRRVPGSQALLLLLLAISFWVFAYTLELNVPSLAGKLFWAKVEYFGIVLIPIAYILFSLKYVDVFGKVKKPRRLTAVLLIIPLLTVLFAWTNEAHGLIWATTSLIQDENLTYLALEHGIWFWVNIGFVYLLLMVSTIILLRKIITTPNQFRGQIILILVGSFWPWFGNALYITGKNPFPHLDLTPFAFALTALLFTVALFRFKFLDIVPIARERVVEQLESGVIVLDFQNRIVDVNQTAVSLMQKDKNSLLGQPLELSHPSWLPLEVALTQNQNNKFELNIDNTYFEAAITPLEHTKQQANGRLITLHNITQRKQTELLLQQAKETAEAANQAKTHFLTNMSHEIRTPLNAVVGMAQMLRQTNINPNQGEMVDVIAQSSNTLVELINNILDFSRLEAGNLSLNTQTFDLVDCLEASLESVQQAANDKLISLTYHIAEETPAMLTGDPVRLRQILVNLLENGIKFSEEGNVHIDVDHIQKKTGIMLDFVVRDTGIGIAPEQISQLFSPFQQIDGSLTRSHGGNGLGLIICKRLVEHMGGDIYLLSEVNQGTSVHFSVQMKVASEQQTPDITLSKNSTSLTGRRLLIVAKDAAQRRHISKEARMAGLEVYVASSSQETTYWIDNSLPFDVVLLDTAVWQQDPAILGQLKNKETLAPLPSVLIGPDEETLHQSTLATPGLFAGTLTLPINGPRMYDLFMSVFSGSSSKRSSRAPGEVMADRYPLTILLVEDNQLNRRVIQNMLDKLGYKIDTAENGRLAVEKTNKQSYDIILMDIQMPEMDGVTATKQILANCAEDEKQPYIAAVTAHALAGDRESYLAAGMHQYLSKPVTINKLVELLYQGIQYQQDSAQLPTAVPANAPTPKQTPEPAPANAPMAPIDLEELERLVGEETAEFLEMMAPIFLEDTANLMRALETAVQNKDAKAMQHAAHTLKGTSASMGMRFLSSLSRKLEAMAKENQLEESPETFAQIQVEYQRVQVALAETCNVPA